MSKEKQTFKSELRTLQRQAYKFHKTIEKEVGKLAYKYDLGIELEEEIKGFHLDIETILYHVDLPEVEETEEEKEEDTYWLSKINKIPRG